MENTDDSIYLSKEKKKSSLGNIHMGQIPPLNVLSPQANYLLSSASIHTATRYEYWCCFRHTCSFPSADVVKAVCAMIPPSLTQQFQQIYFQRKCENLVLKPRQRTLLCKKEDILTNPPLNFKKTISKMWLARVNPKRNYIPHHRCKPSLKQKRDLNYVHYSLGLAFALISK